MDIFLNKERITISQSANISELISSRNIDTKNIAVAVNMKVIKKTEWDSYVLKEDDKVIIIGATKGG